MQNIAHAALSGLRIYAYYVGVVLPAHVVRVDGQIRNVPMLKGLVLPPLHALGNCILMGAGKCRKDKFARIRLAGIDCHACERAVERTDIRHVFKVEAGVYALREHVHGKSYYIHVAGALSVAEQRALHPVGARKYAHLGGGDGTAAVVVGMERKHYAIPVLHKFVEVFHLLRIHMRHGIFYGGGQVYHCAPLRRGLPDIEHGVDHLQGVLRLGTRERFGGIFKAVVGARLLGQLF